jgi:hypothetical protein
MGVKRRRRPRLSRLFDYQLGPRPFKAQERGQHPHRRPFSRRLLGPRPSVATHRAHCHTCGRQARSPSEACRTCSISLTVEYLVANEGNGARLPDAAPFSWIGSRSSERFGLLSRRASRLHQGCESLPIHHRRLGDQHNQQSAKLRRPGRHRHRLPLSWGISDKTSTLGLHPRGVGGLPTCSTISRRWPSSFGQPPSKRYQVGATPTRRSIFVGGVESRHTQGWADVPIFLGR